MTICKSEQCFGCAACANICPRHAIKMSEDAFGMKMPIIDDMLCVECGLCKKVCPSLSSVALRQPISYFAAWANQAKIRNDAASAGIVSAVSFNVLSSGGVVFGTCFKDSKLIFDYITSVEDLDKFKGSKYIHADVNNAYTLVKKFVSENRRVLFVGTPCQIAGLKSYLRKDYDNLLTIDLVCHGVSPQKYLQEYVRDYIGIKKFDKVLFRGREGNRLVVYDHDGAILYSRLKFIDLYSMAYAKGLIMRENCFSCPFASIMRCGDITAGDFWGIDKRSLSSIPDDVAFVSLALANSQKGLTWLSNSDIHLEPKNLSEVLSTNRQFSAPCLRHNEYESVKETALQNGIAYALKRTTLYKQIKKDRIKYLIHRAIHRLIRK